MPDGALCLVALQILVFNVLSGVVLATLHTSHHDYVYSLSWSKDDTALVSASSDATAKVSDQKLQQPDKRIFMDPDPCCCPLPWENRRGAVEPSWSKCSPRQNLLRR